MDLRSLQKLSSTLLSFDRLGIEPHVVEEHKQKGLDAIAAGTFCPECGGFPGGVDFAGYNGHIVTCSQLKETN